MADDRWYRVAVPILEYVADHGGPLELLNVAMIADAIGVDRFEVAAELERLGNAGYLAGHLKKLMSGGDPSGWFLEDSSLGERGLRAVGAWPSDDPYNALIELLDRQIAATPDPAEKSRLAALKSSAAEVGKATIVGILTQLATGGIHF